MGGGIGFGFGSAICCGLASRVVARELVPGFFACAVRFVPPLPRFAVAGFLAALVLAAAVLPVAALLAVVLLAADVRLAVAARGLALAVDRPPVVFRAAVVVPDLLAVDRAAAGFAADSVLAAVVSALAAVFIALVAVAIARMAVDMVRAEAVALVAAEVTLVAADETLVAADDTLVAADAGVVVRRAVVADFLVPAADVRLAPDEPDLLDVLFAAVALRVPVARLAAGFLAADVRPAVARTVVVLAPDFVAADVLVVRALLVVDLVRPVLAELRRAAAVRVAVFVGTDLFPP